MVSSLRRRRIRPISSKRSAFLTRRRQRIERRTVNTLFLIHGVLGNKRQSIPWNIELITFTQSGNSLSLDVAIKLMSILQRNSDKLNRLQFETRKYALLHNDGITKSSIFTRQYKPFDDYPDITIGFENTFGELDSLGFYDTHRMSLSKNPILTNTGSLKDITLIFCMENNIQLHTYFPLSTLLNWISQRTAPNTICRVYLLSCQGFDVNQPPSVENMNLNAENTDYSNEVNRM